MTTIDLIDYDESKTCGDIARELIKLPEKHPGYPSLWRSLCGNWRIIRCKDDIQYIVQRYRNEKKGWEGKSFHVGWKSISLIHGHNDDFKTVTQPI